MGIIKVFMLVADTGAIMSIIIIPNDARKRSKQSVTWWQGFTFCGSQTNKAMMNE